jgi:hypothetical protein
MKFLRNVTLSALTGLAGLLASLQAAEAAIVEHAFDFTLTTVTDPFGRGAMFDLVTGQVSLNTIANANGLVMVPSNGGGNLQFLVQEGSGGGVVVTSAAPSFLAVNFAPGDVIGPAIADAPDLPGYSASASGSGKIRFFGSGNFASGETGYIGFRLGSGLFGFAEVSGIDNQSITLHRTAIETTPGLGITITAAPVPLPAPLGVTAACALLALGRRRRHMAR